MTVLDVQVFELVTLLGLVQLVRDHLLQAHSLVVQKCNHRVIVTSVTDVVVAGTPFLVYVKLLTDVFVRLTALDREEEGNIFVV